MLLFVFLLWMLGHAACLAMKTIFGTFFFSEVLFFFTFLFFFSSLNDRKGNLPVGTLPRSNSRAKMPLFKGLPKNEALAKDLGLTAMKSYF